MTKPQRRSIMGYGWNRDIPDFRDRLLQLGAPRKLPESMDLRNLCSPVEDQGNLGACTAHGIAGALEFLDNKEKRPMVRRSRLQIYYGEREIEHTIKQDAGAMIRDGIKVCAKTGSADEKLWPYKVSKFAQKPPLAVYTDAAKRKITSYARVTSLIGLRTSLADGFPVVFGFSVYESFESDEVSRTGVVPMPGSSEQQLGGHCVLAVGYDDAAKRVWCRNSWAASWGVGGYFTMPYDYVSSKDLADDFWQVRQ